MRDLISMSLKLGIMSSGTVKVKIKKKELRKYITDRKVVTMSDIFKDIE